MTAEEVNKVTMHSLFLPIKDVMLPFDLLLKYKHAYIRVIRKHRILTVNSYMVSLQGYFEPLTVNKTDSIARSIAANAQMGTRVSTETGTEVESRLAIGTNVSMPGTS